MSASWCQGAKMVDFGVSLTGYPAHRTIFVRIPLKVVAMLNGHSAPRKKKSHSPLTPIWLQRGSQNSVYVADGFCMPESRKTTLGKWFLMGFACQNQQKPTTR